MREITYKRMVIMFLFRIFMVAFFVALPITVNAQSNTYKYCTYDYIKYCSAYSISTKEGQDCMRMAGPKLSDKCINALVLDKYITKDEVFDLAADAGISIIETENGLKKVGAVAEPPLPERKPEEEIDKEIIVADNSEIISSDAPESEKNILEKALEILRKGMEKDYIDRDKVGDLLPPKAEEEKPVVAEPVEEKPAVAEPVPPPEVVPEPEPMPVPEPKPEVVTSPPPVLTPKPFKKENIVKRAYTKTKKYVAAVKQKVKSKKPKTYAKKTYTKRRNSVIISNQDKWRQDRVHGFNNDDHSITPGGYGSRFGFNKRFMY